MLSTEYDECQTEDHGCQHICVNTIGGYRCECKIGYELNPDGRTCEGKAKVKVNVDLYRRLVVNTPLRRSGMARVLKGSHSLTCTPRVHPLSE